MPDTSDRDTRLDELLRERTDSRRTATLGWMVGGAGIGLWAWGLFADEAMPLLDWAGLAPDWIAAMFRNWMCEAGLVLSGFGTGRVWAVQYREWRIGGELDELAAQSRPAAPPRAGEGRRHDGY